jgi:imidazolonepropionase-like amidohydrolase
MEPQQIDNNSSLAATAAIQVPLTPPPLNPSLVNDVILSDTKTSGAAPQLLPVSAAVESSSSWIDNCIAIRCVAAFDGEKVWSVDDGEGMIVCLVSCSNRDMKQTSEAGRKKNMQMHPARASDATVTATGLTGHLRTLHALDEHDDDEFELAFGCWKTQHSEQADIQQRVQTDSTATVECSGCILEFGYESQVELPVGVEVLDLKQHMLMPGLIDGHSHPTIWSDDYQMNHLKRSSSFKALRAAKRVQQCLYHGWTTIRSAGDADELYPLWDVRRAIEHGMYPGPRLCGAGHYISITGGGGDLNFIPAERCKCMHADGKIVDGPEEMRRAVREEVKFGSDWIKIMVTGAFMSSGDNPSDVHMSSEEIEMAVNEAARLGVPVMAHCHSADGIVAALDAGVRSIEHATFIDERGIQLALENSAFVVPTLFIGDYFDHHAAPTGALSKMLDIQNRTRAKQEECMRNLVASGIPIVCGTDYCGWSPELNVRELECLAEYMEPIEVLKAATSNAADMLNWGQKLGRIRKGLCADLIAVRLPPDTSTVSSGSSISSDLSSFDMRCMRDVEFVMLNGDVIRDDSKNQ